MIPNYFRHDLVRIGAQAMEDLGAVVFANMMTSYKNKSLKSFTKYSNQLLGILEDMNTLYATNPYTLLGTWLEGAKALGESDVEKRNNEYNARNIITLWGPSGQISDYANKNWAGLIKTYYKVRWQRFVNALMDSLKTGKKYDEGAFQYNLLVWAEGWCKGNTPFPTEPTGDVLALSESYNEKYTNLLRENKDIASKVWKKALDETRRKKPDIKALPFLGNFENV